jgi:uncharacterized damage-inducible protein DinB
LKSARKTVTIDIAQKLACTWLKGTIMICKISEFISLWKSETEATLKLFSVLTDPALTQAVSPGDRTLGRLAWHITTTIPEMMGHVGLPISAPAVDAPVPATALEIVEAYRNAAASLLELVQSQWSDATLDLADNLYGEPWKRGFTLTVLIHHQIHHRGQMTVLLRQARLTVPGIYGPAREEWANLGMPEPTV